MMEDRFLPQTLAAMLVLAAPVAAQELSRPDAQGDADYQLNRNPNEIDSHAAGAPNTEMLQAARAHPDEFIGKTLKFDGGDEVGPIKDIRRRTQDEHLYLVVDAAAFFNEKVDFAIPVGDLIRFDDKFVYIAMAPGRHLRGMEYYPKDYEDVDAGETGPITVDQ